ncbi:MAG: ADP-ribosylglycohydrolase family protein [Leptospira sp.]|nr:ADP-ribosylglycohydrolase family protein [Leptospira sp.]
MKLDHSTNTIVGAIAGDVIGSVYEWNNHRDTDFEIFSNGCFFTDDSVLTIAVADAILKQKDFGRTIWEYGRTYPGRGYGGRFSKWLQSSDPKPYNSFGNGSAMRVSALGFAYDTLEEVLDMAEKSALPSHNHPEGIKGAQATASAIWLAKNGESKATIQEYITKEFQYDLGFSLDEIRPTYEFNETCHGSVPQSIVAFLESEDFESAIRLAISIGGDSDTIACITGGIASAYYKEIPKPILDFVGERLPSEFIQIIQNFDARRGK